MKRAGNAAVIYCRWAENLRVRVWARMGCIARGRGAISSSSSASSSMCACVYDAGRFVCVGEMLRLCFFNALMIIS